MTPIATQNAHQTHIQYQPQRRSYAEPCHDRMQTGSYCALNQLPDAGVTDSWTVTVAKEPPSQPDEGKEQRDLQRSCEVIDYLDGGQVQPQKDRRQSAEKGGTTEDWADSEHQAQGDTKSDRLDRRSLSREGQQRLQSRNQSHGMTSPSPRLASRSRMAPRNFRAARSCRIPVTPFNIHGALSCQMTDRGRATPSSPK
jgi:hypothetical protein